MSKGLKREHRSMGSIDPDVIDLESDDEVEQDQVEDDQYNVPDLDGYFNMFHLSRASRIGVCRTYANYLASQERSAMTVKKMKTCQIHKNTRVLSPSTPPLSEQFTGGV